MNKTFYSVGALFLLSLFSINKYLFFNVPKCYWNEVSGYKLLLVGDPQIEGDAKIKREPYTGALDLWVNSKYLSFVYGRAIERLEPAYSVILGDLFSSQWIDDTEFENRVERFRRMFPEQSEKFKTIYLPGNHDIGYGSDMTQRRVDRFKRAFGEVNYWFFLYDENGVEHHRVVVLNSMNLDSSTDKELRRETWTFLKSVVDEQETKPIPLILLTHVPLHKEVQWCVDKPMTRTDIFNYVTEQNMLSMEVSSYILTQLKPNIIVTGHDHHGCASVHLIELSPHTLTEDNSMSLDLIDDTPEINNEGAEPQLDEKQSDSTEVLGDSTQTSACLSGQCVNLAHNTGDLFKDYCDLHMESTDSAFTRTEEQQEDQIEDDGVPDLSIDSRYSFTTLPYSRSEYLRSIRKNLTSVTLEFTVRSIMGDYGGNLGLLEIHRTATGGWDYHYLDCPYFNHLIIRIVWIINLVTFLVVAATALYTGLGPLLHKTKIKTL